MYYEQTSHTECQPVSEYYYKSGGDLPPVMVARTVPRTSFEKRVYSFRSSRPKNDSTTAVVPGESLICNSSIGNKGVGAYLASYKAAIQSLNDEAGQVSTNSGYGIMDKGHYFSSRRVHYTNAVLHGHSCVDQGGKSLSRPFESAVSLYPYPDYYLPGYESHLPTEVGNAIQHLALSTVPDKINGSLGQDLVDIAELPKLVTHLATVGRELVHLQSTWARLSVKARHAIDVCIRDRSAAPKWALRSAGSGYLEWLFVLSPYIEDMKLIMRTLSKTSSALLKRFSFTRNMTASDVTSSRTGSGMYSGGIEVLTFNHTERSIYSVHLAIAWVRRGPLPSDDTFASKAVQMNRDLGVWYPSLLWDLTPWTWLIDWCTHIGDTIDGTYAVSNSAFRPAYAWATVRHTLQYDGSFVPFFVDDTDVQDNRFLVSNRSLYRFPVRVTGVVQPSFSDLSSDQRKILGALGLSHLK